MASRARKMRERTVPMGQFMTVGDLFVAQTFDLAQRDGLPKILRQGFDGRVDRGGDFLAGQQGFGRLAVG
jgi:hypothetical protein